MTANSFPHNALRGTRGRERGPESRQEIDRAEVAPARPRKKSRKGEDDPRESSANSNLDNRMQSGAAGKANSVSCNALADNNLRGIQGLKSDEKTGQKREPLIAPSTLLRWCKFNLVGGIGIVVQFAALLFLKSAMHFNYLFATVIAVEAAVLHNFLWHEQFTWADRTKADRARAVLNWRRLVRFNLSNGAVSILGNLALMKAMVGVGHMNYLLANGIAIGLCSVANFLVSNKWVFEEVPPQKPGWSRYGAW